MLPAMGRCCERLPDSSAPMRTGVRLVRHDVARFAICGSDYFEVIMRVGRPIWRGARLRRAG